MANAIYYTKRQDLKPIEMSNGFTSVMVSVLSLAASSIASTDNHRKFAIWLAAHDQSVFGLGLVDICIENMPWNKASFEEEREFVFSVLNAALNKVGRDKLGYSPREDWIASCIDKLKTIINEFNPEDIEEDDTDIIKIIPNPPYSMCEKHFIYKHSCGCVICNDK